MSISHSLRVVLMALALSIGLLQPAGIASAQADCVNATVTTRDPEPQMLWTLNPGTWRVLTFWSNQQDDPRIQVLRKVPPLAPDQYIEVLGGGTLYSWPAHCERQVRDNYNRIRLDAVSTDQLGADEWLCCDRNVIGLWEAYWNQTAAPVATTQTEGCPAPKHETVYNARDVEIAGPAIVWPWWNDRDTGWGQAQTKVPLRSGQQTTFVRMMGETRIYENSTACNNALESEMQRGNFDRKELADYRAKNLIR